MAYTTQIQQLYVAYFNRPADPGGLAYWETIVENAKGNTSAVSAAFAASAEYKAAYAGLDANHIVNTVYNNLFGHDADIGGLNFYASLLNNGSLSVNQIVATIAGGAQSTDKVAYNDKVTAATAFTSALTTTQQVLGYSGPDALAAAKAFISTVTNDATLATAINPTNLGNTVNQIVSIGNPEVAAEVASNAAAVAYANAAVAATAANTQATTDAAALTTALATQVTADAAAAAVNTAALAAAAATAVTNAAAAATALSTAQAAVAADQVTLTAAIAAGDPVAVSTANGQLLIDQNTASNALTANSNANTAVTSTAAAAAAGAATVAAGAAADAAVT